MKTVIYSCPFVPAEWIAAHGLRPSRCLPGLEPSRSAASPAGFCPYAWSFLRAAGEAPDTDVIVFTTVCDQMRRASERVVRESGVPVFVLNVPATWQTDTARRLYSDELKRVGRFLIRLGGREPSAEALAGIMEGYDDRRAALRATRGRVSARQYSEAIARFHRDGTVDQTPLTVGDASTPGPPPQGVPVVLVGGPIVPQHFPLFDIIESAGGRVVLDGTGSGERSMPPPFDRCRLRRDPFEVLVDTYFRGIPDAYRRPNHELYEWLGCKIRERAARGVIHRSYTWCDTWRAEAQRMREWADVPVLAITTGVDREIGGHTVSRIEAFMEMLA